MQRDPVASAPIHLGLSFLTANTIGLRVPFDIVLHLFADAHER